MQALYVEMWYLPWISVRIERMVAGRIQMHRKNINHMPNIHQTRLELRLEIIYKKQWDERYCFDRHLLRLNKSANLPIKSVNWLSAILVRLWPWRKCDAHFMIGLVILHELPIKSIYLLSTALVRLWPWRKEAIVWPIWIDYTSPKWTCETNLSKNGNNLWTNKWIMWIQINRGIFKSVKDIAHFHSYNTINRYFSYAFCLSLL